MGDNSFSDVGRHCFKRRETMGSGSFDARAYRSYSKSVASKPIEEVFTSRGLDPALDPRGVTLRESRDSEDNPEAFPIIAALDVSGSMGIIAEYFAKEGLGALFQGILDKKPVKYPHLMFMAYDDLNVGNPVPLQVSQFEADNRIVEQLTKIYVEGGGGGNNSESDDLAWYFAGRYTEHDNMVKRGRRGLLYTIGDEEAPTHLNKERLKERLGYNVEADIPASLSLEEARRKYDVYHVVIEQGDYARSRPNNVKASWRKALGQHVIHLSDYKLLAETIVASIQVAAGEDHHIAASGWGAAAASVIGRAVADLPRGVPAPRQLGR
jgi:hypothetical protein